MRYMLGTMEKQVCLVDSQLSSSEFRRTQVPAPLWLSILCCPVLLAGE